MTTLHPSITHINAKNISESTIKIINKMVEKVNEMDAQELFNLKQSQMETLELIEKTKNLLSELCKTGGQSLTMRVPPTVNDFDMLVCETLRRLSHLTTEVTRLREALEEGELKLKSIKGELILHDLFQIAAFKNEDGMPVIKYVDKPNGGSVAYIRHDSMVKKINSFTQALTPTK